MNKKWVTLFERYQEYHLQKDVGQIPYYAHSALGYDVELWCRANMDNKIAYECFDRIDIKADIKIFNIYLKIFLRMVCKAKVIDVLSLFHYRKYSLIIAFVYKFFNPKGVVLLKCDASDNVMPFDDKKTMINFFIKFLSKSIDIALVEHRSVQFFLEKNNVNTFYMPNGVGNELIEKQKEIYTGEKPSIPTLVFVGKCGDLRKNAELAINVLAGLPEKLIWKAKFLGGETAEFTQFYNSLLAEKEYLSDKIEFLGYVTDIGDIAKIYNESHIFLMTSLYEGYPISLVEACWMGCMPILSSQAGGRDLVTHSAGYIYSDDKELRLFLYNAIINLEQTLQAGRICKNYVMKHNDWRTNFLKLNGVINHE
jgi:glycosyltransferase involved in cell wall biosynthesis